MEFATLVFFVLLLGLLIFKIVDLLEAFLIIEGLSFVAYILAGFEKDTKTASSVGIQYLIIGSISSIFLVISILLVYYQFSTSNLLNISTTNLFYQNTGGETAISSNFLDIVYSFQNIDLSDITSLLLDSSKTLAREKDFINGQHNFPDILLTNKVETDIFDPTVLPKFSQAFVPLLAASAASHETLEKVSYTATTLNKSFTHS